MGVYLAPRPVTDGLVIHIDATNEKSFISGSTYVYGLSNTLVTGSRDVAFTTQSVNAGISVFTLDGTATTEINLSPDSTPGIGSDWFPFYDFTFELAFKSMGSVPTTGTVPGLIGFTYGVRMHIQADGDLLYGLDDGVSAFNNYVIQDRNYLGEAVWHIFQWTNTNQTSSVYIDNELVAGPIAHPWTGSTRYPTNVIEIGRDQNNSNNYFTGSFGHFKFYNRGLSEAELTQNYKAVKNRYLRESIVLREEVPPPNPILNGLVVAYSFEDTGSVFTPDTGSTFGTGNSVATVSTGSFSGAGNSLYYDPASNAVSSVSHSAEFEMTGSNALTMMVDLYPTANGPSGTSNIAGFWLLEGGNHVYYIGYRSDNTIRGRVYDTTNRDLNTTATVPLNTWGRVIMRYESGSVLQVHVSGSAEETGSVAVGDITNGSVNELGFHISTPPYFSGYAIRQFEGRVDNVMIWDRKLSDAERDELFTGNPTYNDLI